MLNHVDMYDALYLLAADDGREAALFGDCQPLAREAFSRSQIGEEFPTVCFEVPLLGKPRFDLHVAISRAALLPGVEFAPGAGGVAWPTNAGSSYPKLPSPSLLRQATASSPCIACPPS